MTTTTPYDPIVREWERKKRIAKPRKLDSHIRSFILGGHKYIQEGMVWKRVPKGPDERYKHLALFAAPDSAHERAELEVLMQRYITIYRAYPTRQSLPLGRGDIHIERGSVHAAAARLWKRYSSVNGTGYLAVWLRTWEKNEANLPEWDKNTRGQAQS